MNDKLGKGLSNLLDKYDVGVSDFAYLVAEEVKNSYGTHNYQAFLDIVKKELNDER